jgi:hypothetical protein
MNTPTEVLKASPGAATGDCVASAGAIEAIYRAQAARFRGLAAAVAGPDVASDVVQGAFALALRRRASWRGEGPLEAWLWRLVLNAARDAERGRVHHRPGLADRIPAEGLDHFLAEPVCRRKIEGRGAGLDLAQLVILPVPLEDTLADRPRRGLDRRRDGGLGLVDDRGAADPSGGSYGDEHGRRRRHDTQADPRAATRKRRRARRARSSIVSAPRG